jgi:hypothetical protein
MCSDFGNADFMVLPNEHRVHSPFFSPNLNLSQLARPAS